MRLRLGLGAGDYERAARLALFDRIDVFWADAAARLRMSSEGPGAVAELERGLDALLSRVHPGLSLELENDADGARSVIGPRDDAALEQVALAVLERAPKGAGCTALRHHLGLPAALAVEAVRTRAGVDLHGARARIGFARGHLLEVVLYASGFASAVDEAALDAANLLLPRLVGGEAFDDWVGAVDVAPLPRGSSLRLLSDSSSTPDASLPLSEVALAVRTAIQGARAALPPEPYHVFCERGDWVLLELTPEGAEDYPGLDDLAFISTMLPEGIKSFLEGARFSSGRFSNHGERFVYVKLDGESFDDEERLERRHALEESLNAMLVPGRVGCVVGAGVGLRYVYLFLALQDFEHGLGLVRKVAQKLDAPRRSWIHCCDSAWADEWLGIWDETPPPPERG